MHAPQQLQTRRQYPQPIDGVRPRVHNMAVSCSACVQRGKESLFSQNAGRIDIGGIQEQAAGWRIRAAALRGGAEHGMDRTDRSEEHTSELQSLMRLSYAGFCFK